MPLVGQDPPLQRLLGEQQDAGAAEPRGERALALGAVDRRRLEQLPAVEDRLRVDPRRAAAGRADREVDVRVDALGAGADPAEHGSGDHLRADPQRAVVAGDVGASPRVAPPIARRSAPRSGSAAGAAAGSGFRSGPAAPCRSASPQCDARGRSRPARRRCSGCRRCLRGRRTCPSFGRSCRSCDHPVVDRDDRGALGGEDVDPAPGRRGGDHFGRVAGGVALPGVPRQRCPGRDVVGVAGVGGDREVGALGQPGQRADQVGRAACRRRGRRAAPPARTSRRGCRRRSRRRGSSLPPASSR